MSSNDKLEVKMSLEDVDLEAGILSDLQKLAAKFHLKELIYFWFKG